MPSRPPTIDWLRGKLYKQYGQRFTFRLSASAWIMDMIVRELKYDPQTPVMCNGIFCGLYSVPKDYRIGFARPSDCEIRAYFRDCLFEQGQISTILGKRRSYNKHARLPFGAKDIAGKLPMLPVGSIQQ